MVILYILDLSWFRDKRTEFLRRASGFRKGNKSNEYWNIGDAAQFITGYALKSVGSGRWSLCYLQPLFVGRAIDRTGSDVR